MTISRDDVRKAINQVLNTRHLPQTPDARRELFNSLRPTIEEIAEEAALNDQEERAARLASINSSVKSAILDMSMDNTRKGEVLKEQMEQKQYQDAKENALRAYQTSGGRNKTYLKFIEDK